MWSPRWSPDGRYIAALDRTWSLVVFNFKTQKWMTLSKGFCGFPIWSPDSRSIYYYRTTATDKILRVAVNGGEEEEAFALPLFSYTGALTNWFGIDPGGAPMMLRDAGSDEIYSLTVSQR